MKKPVYERKTLAGALVGSGIFLVFHAWTMDVTAHSNIVNIGLLDDRRNILLMGIFLVGIGIYLFASEKKVSAKPPNERSPENPPCQRDLSLAPYKIWLVTRYSIRKNDVLDSFVCQEQLFSSVDAALEYAHSLETQKFEEKQILDQQQKKRRERESIARAESLRASRDAREKHLASIIGFIRTHRLKIACVTFSLIALFSSIHLYDRFLFKKYFEAEAAISEAEEAHKAANLRWVAARDAAAKKLEHDELENFEVGLEASADGSGYDVVIVNNSRYHVDGIEGFIFLYSKGLEFPYNSTTINCCPSAIPPGGSELIRGAVKWSYAWAGSEMQNFAKVNGIKLSRGKDGITTFPLDGRARLGDDASIDLFFTDESTQKTNPKNISLRRVDFTTQAEKLPEVVALYDSKGELIIEKRRREFAEAKSALYSWRNIRPDFDNAVD